MKSCHQQHLICARGSLARKYIRDSRPLIREHARIHHKVATNQHSPCRRRDREFRSLSPAARVSRPPHSMCRAPEFGLETTPTARAGPPPARPAQPRSQPTVAPLPPPRLPRRSYAGGAGRPGPARPTAHRARPASAAMPEAPARVLRCQPAARHGDSRVASDGGRDRGHHRTQHHRSRPLRSLRPGPARQRAAVSKGGLEDKGGP